MEGLIQRNFCFSKTTNARVMKLNEIKKYLVISVVFDDVIKMLLRNAKLIVSGFA